MVLTETAKTHEFGSLDVPNSTLELVIRISINKLRLLHNTLQPVLTVPVLRNDNPSSSGPPSPSSGLGATQRNIPQPVSTSNRLVRSLLITRIARKARTLLMTQQQQQQQQPQARSPSEYSVPVSSSDHTDATSGSNVSPQPSSYLNMSNPPATMTTIDFNTTQTNIRKRFSSRTNENDEPDTKQTCMRSNATATPPTREPGNHCHALNEVEIPPSGTFTTATLTVNYWSSDTSPPNAVIIDESGSTEDFSVSSDHSSMIPRHVLSSRGISGVSGPDQSNVCHMQPNNSVPMLNTITYRLLPGVS